jgi:NAD(P)-dependent dehydrogenase (short-subunit alcohol dehydrogenase family)
MELRRDGQIALVTGSSMRIGNAVAKMYGHAGARVVVNSRDEARAQAATAALSAEGIETFPVAADLTLGSGILDGLAHDTPTHHNSIWP